MNTALSKVPEVTVAFWMIKVLATTLGETGGDAVSMSMELGYLLSSAIFGVLFLAAVSLQISRTSFHPTVYWLTIIATTTVGTTLADFADRSLGIGYAGGSLLLLALLIASLLIWQKTMRTVSVHSITSRKAELFYWVTIMFSQTLGTALGDWVADTEGLGYGASILIFGGILLGLTGLYFTTRVSRVFLFWAAFILTRPLGAVVGDFLDKPVADGGLELSRYAATLALLAGIALLMLAFPQKAATKAH
ncbi:COG4705 family protein [Thalassolituus sp. LLYu03]|uniref:COG4705 family protein n=1 Tax=Thalassolituus sp. LLYu03 TaxID=3421656 RepID=UPI003D2CB991